MYKPKIFLLWYPKLDIKFLLNLKDRWTRSAAPRIKKIKNIRKYIHIEAVNSKYYRLQYLWKINFRYSVTTYANRLHKHVLWHVYTFLDSLLWMSVLNKTFIEWFTIRFWKKNYSETICMQKRRWEMDYLLFFPPNLVLDHCDCPNSI